MTAFSISPGPLTIPYAQACARLDEIGFADGLWNRRVEVWTSDAAVQRKIAHRLGWLDSLDFMTPHLPRLRAFAEGVRRDGFTDVVLLGMGGSSLAPEVLRQVLGTAAGYPRFTVLDSVDPDAVRAAFARAATSLFVLASKSGSTIEPNAMAAEAQRRVIAAGHAAWGERFVAITDDTTPLHQRAIAHRFRDVFLNPHDIGGRFSALSYFGLVPAALMGADLEAILDSARQMAGACRANVVADNPGLALGAFMAAGVRTGRDKLTVLLPDPVRSFGLWVEQLIAESTGKQGTGVVPIVGETPAAPFGSDRCAVVISVNDALPPPDVIERVRGAALPAATLEMGDALAIGAEFLRWEVATAAAGFLLGINPFDEPNVQQAKDATRALLDRYKVDRRLPLPEPDAASGGARLALSTAARDRLEGAPAQYFLELLTPGDYLALLAFLPPDGDVLASALQQFRADTGAAAGCATMFGYGPRYLHSTGQLHKGGKDNGLFIIVSAAAEADLPVPGEPYSFGVLELAQALGDFQSLDRAGRRVLYLHLPERDVQLLRKVLADLLSTSKPAHSPSGVRPGV